jgi:hypothetical protein
VKRSEGKKYDLNSLLVAGHNNANTTTRNIPESNVESTEIIANNEEHPEWRHRVLDFRQEIGCEAERQRNLCGLVEVGLQDVLVEDQEAFQHLELMLVWHCAANLVVEVGVVEGLDCLQTLVGERWPRDR